MKTIIIGGVAGGASAAARLRRLDEKSEIIMIEREEHISYANCGLPYYIGGTITDKEELTLQTPESFRERFAVDVRTRHEVMEIETARKVVRVYDHINDKEYEETYDKLILSPGAKPILPHLPNIEDERIFTLRTIPDTYRIYDHVRKDETKAAVVVGGGFIGLEMAENLVRAGLCVTIVELSEHVLNPLDYEVACDVHEYLRQKGIELLLSRAVKAFHPEPKKLTVELDNGDRVKADLVIMSIGITPESTLAEKAGLDMNGRGAILVDKQMKTSDPHIYAVGDAVEVTNLINEKPTYIPLAGPANKQGRIAADNIYGLNSTYKGSQGSSIVKVFDLTVASTGLNERDVKKSNFSYDKIYVSSPSHATYYPDSEMINMKVIFEQKNGRLLGAQLVGPDGVDKRCDLFATAIRMGMTAFDLAELELCYAPPFSSAKDPVNMAGFAIENVMTGKIKQFHWHDVEKIQKDEKALLLDVRTDEEYTEGYIPGNLHIPLDSLRERLKEIDQTKTLYIYCRSGLRSYIACRMLMQNGFVCHNLSGGYTLYNLVMSDKSANAAYIHRCREKL
ncbi:MAG: FAD-dependent oxidoreductase [Bacillota bacterium]